MFFSFVRPIVVRVLLTQHKGEVSTRSRGIDIEEAQEVPVRLLVY